MPSLKKMGTLAASLALGFTTFSRAQELTVKPAVELVFQTEANQGYSLLQSGDLGGWRPLGGQIFGDGATVSRLVAASKPADFFQLERFEVRDLNPMLEQIRAARKVPALACAVVVSNRVVGLGAVGLRRAGVANAPVTLADKWHHGSNTKSMTATLAAILVEEGRVQWTNTVADIFPGLTSRMHPGWLAATLEQLTSNRGGAPGAIPSAIWSELWFFKGTPFEGRRLLLERMAANPPASTPGTAYEYSNAGFAMAGHMLETVMGEAWESLVAKRLFAPLGMASAGFGVPATPRHLNQPLGHTLSIPSLPPSASNLTTPSEADANADNPAAIGPAATVHSSVLDLAIYAAFHIAVHRGDTPLLPRDSGLKLHTARPNNQGYAHGWSVVARAWANGDALHHSGSNTMWHSIIWIAPGREFAVVAVCNLGGTTAALATDDIAARMIQEFLP